MKTKALFTSLFIVALVISSCQPTEKTVSVDAFDTLNVSFSYPLYEEEKETPHYTCSISLLYLNSPDSLLQANVNSSIVKAAFGYDSLTPKEAIDTFTHLAIKEYSGNLPSYLNEKEAGDVGHWYNNSFTLTTQVLNGKAGIWNYILYNSFMYGGAHPTTNYFYLNFCSKTGKEIELNDVFTEGFEDALNEKLIGALEKHLGVSTLDEVKEKGFLTMNGMFPSNNFLLEKDSIKFMYNQYDIAPYALGQTELSLAYSNLADILKK